MNTSNYEVDHRQKPQIERFRKPLAKASPVDDEQFDPAGATPIGQLLKLISALPEIRRDKVECVRRQIDHGQYDVNTNLDAALDKVLEEFLAGD
jgi:anti-sigma28 factor (negative regulator of flagellin synthesis)